MPCFLAGQCAAECMGAALGVPVYDFSHQQGHLAAAALSVGRLDLLGAPLLAWHLSGGTTELLLAEPSEERILRASILGGSSDISAGQVIDRVGVDLEMPFPAGPYVEQAALRSDTEDVFPVRVQGCTFSFSGGAEPVSGPHPGRGQQRGCLPVRAAHRGADHSEGDAERPPGASPAGAHLRRRVGVYPGAGSFRKGKGRVVRAKGPWR